MQAIGCDPEWFLKNADGKVVSAIGKIGGTKNKPRPLFPGALGMEGYGVQEDNVALEYNIPPAESWIDFAAYVMVAQEKIEEELKTIGLVPYIAASHSFAPDEMNDPRAWIFGCEPDFDAWEMRMNAKPRCDDPLLRSCGGHIHVGGEYSKIEKMDYVRMLDAYVTIPSLLVDKDTLRRSLYGKAGAMRFKKYGFEYRTPSNFWTTSERRIQWVAKQVQAAEFAMNKGKRYEKEEVQSIINTSDVEAAKAFIKREGIAACPA